jgi:glycerol-3-phosphate dehydrogenase
MPRSLADLAAREFDLLVVGAGIHGACIAREAARRGLRVALIDRGDFGAEASANSQKVLHGGLRYLQQLDLPRMRDSIRSRRHFARVAPHLVRPLPCVVPARGVGLRSPAALAAALAANALASADRNAGVEPAARLPAGRMLSPAACRAILGPGLGGRGAAGGMCWYDALAWNPERLTLACVRDAARAGACVANYAAATALLVRAGRVGGARVADRLDGRGEFDVRARVTLLSAGPWARALLDPVAPGFPGEPLWLKSYGLFARRRWFGDCAVGLEGSRAAGGRRRNLFFVPWRDGTLVGTIYRVHHGDPDACRIEGTDLAALAEEANALHSGAGLDAGDVAFANVALLPARAGTDPRDPDPEPARHTEIADARRAAGVEGLVVVRGVKYTTAPVEAVRVADLACRKLGRPAGPPAPQTAFPAEGPPAGAEADVGRAVRDEWACRLEDVVVRRTELGSAGCPPRAALERCAVAMARELGWDEARRESEIAATRRFYRMHGVGASGTDAPGEGGG